MSGRDRLEAIREQWGGEGYGEGATPYQREAIDTVRFLLAERTKAVANAWDNGRWAGAHDALTVVRGLNGDGFHEPSEPAIEAAISAIQRMIRTRHGDKAVIASDHDKRVDRPASDGCAHCGLDSWAAQHYDPINVEGGHEYRRPTAALDTAEREGADPVLIARLRGEFDEADRERARLLLEDMGYDECPTCQQARFRAPDTQDNPT